MQPWRKLREETVYDRYRRVVSRRFELPDGRVEDFEVRDDGDMVAVLALTGDARVVLVRQFRPGPERLVVELPAGLVEHGADPARVAAAELLEETGYTGTLERVGTTLDGGYSMRTKHVFAARDCTQLQAPDPVELTEPVLLSLAEFRSHMRAGSMADVDAGYLALDHLGLL